MVATVKTPILPIYIIKINTILLAEESSGVMPQESPTVPKAETT